MTIIVNASMFCRIANFRSFEATRYYLNGVYCEPGPNGKGCILTATDGHTLGSILDKNGYCDAPAIIRYSKNLEPKNMPNKSLVDRANVAIPGIPNERSLAYLVIGAVDNAEMASMLSAASDDVYATEKDVVVDGTFPNWRRVIPRGPYAPFHSTFNGKLIDRFVKMAGKGKNDPATLRISGSLDLKGKLDLESPAIVQINSEPNFLGVIMPMCGSFDAPIPAWFNSAE